MNESCFVMGNGPSLRDFDFDDLRGFDTIGMNAAYRYWETINWYPTYYACLDLIVGLSHKDEIGRLITHAKEFGIRGFLLRRNLIEALGDIASKPPVINFDDVCLFSRFFRPPNITTGSHSALWAAHMGYRNVYILGVDCDYTAIVEGAVQRNDLELEIEEEKNNPNYFFEGYQRKGDKYSLPEPTKDLHIESWRLAKIVLDANHVKAVNLNAKSRLDVFPFGSFADIKPESDTLRQSQTPSTALKTITNSNKDGQPNLAKKDRMSSTLRLSIHHDVIAGPFAPTDKAQFDADLFRRKLTHALDDKRENSLNIGGSPPNMETLEAFPWAEQVPPLVMSEWQVDKLGDNSQLAHDVAGFLLHRGYVVVLAEWLWASQEHTPTFQKLACYPTLIDPGSNKYAIIAFKGSLSPERLLMVSLQCLAFGALDMSLWLMVRKTQNWARGLWINSIKPPLRTVRNWVRDRLTPARAHQ